MSKNEVLNELHANSAISMRVHTTTILPDNLSKGLRDTPEVSTLLISHAFDILLSVKATDDLCKIRHVDFVSLANGAPGIVHFLVSLSLF